MSSSASTFDALTFEGRLMRKATSFLLRFIAPERPQGPDWWSYFGSFGDDIFDDDQP